MLQIPRLGSIRLVRQDTLVWTLLDSPLGIDPGRKVLVSPVQPELVAPRTNVDISQSITSHVTRAGPDRQEPRLNSARIASRLAYIGLSEA